LNTLSLCSSQPIIYIHKNLEFPNLCTKVE
jgi:hypothetical protein